MAELDGSFLLEAVISKVGNGLENIVARDFWTCAWRRWPVGYTASEVCHLRSDPGIVYDIFGRDMKSP